jgi:IS1 family transposase
MVSPSNPRRLKLNELRENCASETARFFLSLIDDSWHCYEIFRRAIAEKNSDAWGVIIEQYQSQVARWVVRHPKFKLFSEDVDFFTNRVFEKFWRRNFSAKEFSRFPNVKSLLGYLKTCVASVMTDYWRTQERKKVEYLSDISRSVLQPDGYSVEKEVEYRLQRQHFWNQLRNELPDELEYKVIYASYIIGLKPLEIFRHAPDVFGDVKEVYKIKARALSRLGRVIGSSSYFFDNPEEIE